MQEVGKKVLPRFSGSMNGIQLKPNRALNCNSLIGELSNRFGFLPSTIISYRIGSMSETKKNQAERSLTNGSDVFYAWSIKLRTSNSTQKLEKCNHSHES